MEGDIEGSFETVCERISIHSLRMEGDGNNRQFSIRHFYFNPLPPHGGRRIMSGSDATSAYFNPLPPHGGRPVVRIFQFRLWKFQSTPSAWRETYNENAMDRWCFISIHSLRMEGDRISSLGGATVSVFQSTPSAWRETQVRQRRIQARTHFNPLPPHGGRLRCG